MKAKDLLAKLKRFSKEELELTVYSICDHGQQLEQSQAPSLIWYEDIDEGYMTDKEEAEDYGYTKRAILL